jgi:hypothetical protein
MHIEGTQADARAMKALHRQGKRVVTPRKKW